MRPVATGVIGGVLAVLGSASAMAQGYADATCRQYADQQTAALRAQAGNQAVGSAVVGTVLGAGIGAAVGGGRGAAIGAGTGRRRRQWRGQRPSHLGLCQPAILRLLQSVHAAAQRPAARSAGIWRRRLSATLPAALSTALPTAALLQPLERLSGGPVAPRISLWRCFGFHS